MEICKECGRPLADLEFEKKAKEILGPELKLYDFMNGARVMPMAAPDGGG